MSRTRKKNGSSKKPDATTSNTTTRLKITIAATDLATTGNTTQPGEPTDDYSENATKFTTTDATNNTSPTTLDEPDPLHGLIGKLLVGTYIVKKEIARSNSRRVFEGTDIRNESPVAIVILPDPESPNRHEEFSTEPSRQSFFSVKNNCANSRAKRGQYKNQSHNDRNESALCQLEAETGIKIRAYECEEKLCYCVIALESLDEFENPQPKTARSSPVADHKAGTTQKVVAVSAAFLAASLFGCLSLAFISEIGKVHRNQVTVSVEAVPEEVTVQLTNDSDLNPTNDFIAFDPLFVDGFSTTGKIGMTSINRVIAQSVIVSLNAKDINTSSALFHAQCVASAAKGVARFLRTELVNSSSRFATVFQSDSDKEPCFVGYAQSTNVFFPNTLTSSMPVNYPSSLKSQSPGGKRHNGDEYMAGYSKIQVPIGDTTIDIAGVPVFPLRSNEPSTLDDIKASANADPIDSDYLPPNTILAGGDKTKYSDLVACSVFGSADKDYAACIPRGYIRITNGPRQQDYENSTYNCPVSDSKDDSFVGDLQSSTGLPWLSGESSSNTRRFRSPPANPYYLDDGLERRAETKTTGSPLSFMDRIGKGNAAGAEFFLQRIAARMKQVDPNVTLADVKVALNQGMLRYGGEPVYLYSPGPGAKLQCDLGYPYMSKTIPNDGLNSAVEISVERFFNLDVKDENQRSVFHSGSQRAIFTPATGWRNLLGDITFEYETRNSGTFSRQ